ncbi:MAG TPA: aminotransferase class I/II-fold pyridoxal phosphate-dependent enzyme, partial [Gammaproteobacteria bacterium]|nr:aminotransferase class I/II-fold pyridoxal phosphate-dependent enzyme [Gammaproteobacteria bacterium]
HRALAENIAYFRSRAATLPLLESTTPIQPVLVGEDSAALAIAAKLREAGIYARAIRPPTVPAGTARLRICISAAHTKADIDALVTALAGAFAQNAA